MSVKKVYVLVEIGFMGGLGLFPPRAAPPPLAFGPHVLWIVLGLVEYTENQHLPWLCRNPEYCQVISYAGASIG